MTAALKLIETKPTRVFLTDGSHRWFNPEKASYRREEKDSGQGLYRMPSGVLLVHDWFNDECQEVDPEDAASWLAGHGHDLEEANRAGVAEFWESALASLEIT